MVRRHWIAASIALTLGAGCHAGPPPKLEKPTAPITQSDVSAARFVALHNKNADAITALKAAPSVVALDERGKPVRVSGHLAFERDKNFRLELDGPMRHTVADIGSNEKGFWFWVEDKKEKAIYVCDHKDMNSCTLAISLQPDWIIEAMGLRRFTEDEARKLHASPGEKPGTLVLTQIRKDGRGQTYTKETIVNEANGHIIEHKLYTGLKKDLIASAKIDNYIESKITEPQPRVRPAGNEEDVAPVQTVVYTPEKFHLKWIQEKLEIEIGMSKPRINPVYADAERLALFSEPPIPGTTRRNLAQLDLTTPPPASRVYESKPIPRTGGIRLGNPQPSPIDAGTTTRRAIDPLPLAADLAATPAQPAGVVGAVIPTALDATGASAPPANRWRSPTLSR